MKKIISILCTAALIASLTGCNSGTEKPDTSDNSQVSSPVSDSNDSIDNSGGSGSSDDQSSSDNSDSAPEPQKPDGEPTFLTAPDGTPIYTSEISEVYTGSEENSDKKTITLEQAEQLARSGDDYFTVKCDGFAYGYIRERTLNRFDDPEMFKQSGNGDYFEYLGEEFDINTGEGKYSTEYLRIKVGDKFGSLTVKNVYTLFADKYDYWYGKDFSDVPGAYISDCGIEFDGEIELTGYVNVTKMETLYGEGGEMEFFPDGDSSVKIPGFSYATNCKTGEICHYSISRDGFFGSGVYSLGNMYEVDCDTSGLHPGDSFVKVKVVLDNVKYAPGHLGGWSVELKHIEVL